MVLTYGSLAATVFLQLSGEILFDAVLVKIMLAPEADIATLVLKGELGGESIF